MATQTKDPFVSTDPNIQAKLIAMGAKGASTDTQAQTQAISIKTPGVLVGGTKNADGTQYQAITTNNPAPTAPNTTVPRYLPDGKVNTSAVQAPDASTSASGYTTSTPSTTPPPGPPPVSGISIAAPMTAEQYQASRGVNVDEAAIREDVRKRNQARIDEVNLAADRIYRSQNLVNEANAGSVRGINARSGLLGSDFGNANDANQRDRGNAALSAIREEQAAKVNSIISNIDTLANGEITAKKAEAQGNADAYKNYLNEAQTKAKDYIKNLGASGVSFDDLKAKAPDQLAALLKATGDDEFSLALAMNAARPKAQQIDWKTDIKGNHIISWGTDPITGQAVYQTKELPAEAQGNDVKIVDGEVWSISPDGKTATKIGAKTIAPITKVVGKVLYASEDNGKTWKIANGTPAASPAPTPKQKVKTASAKENEALQKVQSGISKTNVLGPDGYMSPDDYTAFRNAWIQDGFNPTTYDRVFKGFRNPNNPNYITVKQ